MKRGGGVAVLWLAEILNYFGFRHSVRTFSLLVLHLLLLNCPLLVFNDKRCYHSRLALQLTHFVHVLLFVFELLLEVLFESLEFLAFYVDRTTQLLFCEEPINFLHCFVIAIEECFQFLDAINHFITVLEGAMSITRRTCEKFFEHRRCRRVLPLLHSGGVDRRRCLLDLRAYNLTISTTEIILKSLKRQWLALSAITIMAHFWW